MIGTTGVLVWCKIWGLQNPAASEVTAGRAALPMLWRCAVCPVTFRRPPDFRHSSCPLKPPLRPNRQHPPAACQRLPPMRALRTVPLPPSMKAACPAPLPLPMGASHPVHLLLAMRAPHPALLPPSMVAPRPAHLPLCMRAPQPAHRLPGPFPQNPAPFTGRSGPRAA